MKITYLGHSCFLIESAAGRLVLDPFEPGSVPGRELPELEADCVLCSHGHADHGAAERVKLSGRPHGYTVEAVHSFHDGERGALRGENLIHIVSAEGLRIAHLGDLGHELDAEQISRLGNLDVLLIPVGGYYTIDAAGAAAVADALGARITVPMHYRGEGFGYDVIGTLDSFTALRDNVRYARANSFDPAEYAGPVTLVLEA